MKARKSRRGRRLHVVQREERIGPTPEHAQHHRDWFLHDLLAKGPDDGGIDPEQFEAACQIVEGYKAFAARKLGTFGIEFDNGVFHQRTIRDMTGWEERLSAIYTEWADACRDRLRIRAAHVAAIIETDEPPATSTLPVFIKALDLWTRVATDYDRAKAIERRQVQRAIEAVHRIVD